MPHACGDEPGQGIQTYRQGVLCVPEQLILQRRRLKTAVVCDGGARRTREQEYFFRFEETQIQDIGLREPRRGHYGFLRAQGILDYRQWHFQR